MEESKIILPSRGTPPASPEDYESSLEWAIRDVPEKYAKEIRRKYYPNLTIPAGWEFETVKPQGELKKGDEVFCCDGSHYTYPKDYIGGVNAPLIITIKKVINPAQPPTAPLSSTPPVLRTPAPGEPSWSQYCTEDEIETLKESYKHYGGISGKEIPPGWVFGAVKHPGDSVEGDYVLTLAEDTGSKINVNKVIIPVFSGPSSRCHWVTCVPEGTRLTPEHVSELTKPGSSLYPLGIPTPPSGYYISHVIPSKNITPGTTILDSDGIAYKFLGSETFKEPLDERPVIVLKPKGTNETMSTETTFATPMNRPTTFTSFCKYCSEVIPVGTQDAIYYPNEAKNRKMAHHRCAVSAGDVGKTRGLGEVEKPYPDCLTPAERKGIEQTYRTVPELPKGYYYNGFWDVGKAGEKLPVGEKLLGIKRGEAGNADKLWGCNPYAGITKPKRIFLKVVNGSEITDTNTGTTPATTPDAITRLARTVNPPPENTSIRITLSQPSLLPEDLKTPEQCEEPDKLIVTINAGETTERSHSVANFHKQLPDLVRLVANGIDVYLFSELPGTGKTTACQHAADLLNLPYYYAALSINTMPSDLFGHKSPDGTYIGRPFRTWYEHGGLLDLAELDNTNANVFALLNNALDNGFGSFPDGMVPRHPHARLVANGNTIMTGPSEMYPGRLRQDAASQDRFVFLEWELDETLELAIAEAYGGGKHARAWAEWVQAVRKTVSSTKERLVVSPRATKKGLEIFRACPDWTIEKIADAVVFKGRPNKAAILKNTPLPLNWWDKKHEAHDVKKKKAMTVGEGTEKAFYPGGLR